MKTNHFCRLISSLVQIGFTNDQLFSLCWEAVIDRVQSVFLPVVWVYSTATSKKVKV